ncbi:hypothetical protein J3F83DRAFT_746789 [Trichoderma novae-zelandiae]
MEEGLLSLSIALCSVFVLTTCRHAKQLQVPTLPQVEKGAERCAPPFSHCLWVHEWPFGRVPSFHARLVLSLRPHAPPSVAQVPQNGGCGKQMKRAQIARVVFLRLGPTTSPFSRSVPPCGCAGMCGKRST